MNALVTTGNVLFDLKQMLRLSNADNDSFLESLLNRAARNLGTTETVIVKNKTAEVLNNRFYLPDDCKRLVAFRAHDSCIPGILADLDFFRGCGCDTRSLNPLVSILDINGRWANLINKVPDGMLIDIAYQAVDSENGMVTINEEAYTAVLTYAAWQFALAYSELYTPEQRREWKTEYQLQDNRARGLAARRTFEQQREQILSKINQVVNSSVPFSLLAGQYVSFYYPTIRNI
jgi:hypothetical protein